MLTGAVAVAAVEDAPLVQHDGLEQPVLADVGDELAELGAVYRHEREDGGGGVEVEVGGGGLLVGVGRRNGRNDAHTRYLPFWRGRHLAGVRGTSANLLIKGRSVDVGLVAAVSSDQEYSWDWMLPEAREANHLRAQGQHEAALECFRRAYGRAVELQDDAQACGAAHMIAVEIAELKADVHERHDWNLKALEHADRARDERVTTWYASLYGSLGISFRLLGHTDEAQVYLERGRVLADALPDDSYGRMVRSGIASHLALLADTQASRPDD